MKSLTFLWLIALGLTGCASSINVSRLNNDLPAGSRVDGVPFRAMKRFNAVVYEKKSNGYKKVDESPELLVTIPDPYNLYLLGFDALMLSDTTLSLALDSDTSVIQKVTLKSTAKAGQALQNAGSQLVSVAKAEQELAKAEDTSSIAPLDLAIAADKAKQSAEIAALEYDKLKSDSKASPVDILRAQTKMRSAMLDANRAARVANKAPYYPDINP